MTSLSPISTFNFSVNAPVPIFCICQHRTSAISSTQANFTVTTPDSTHLLKATPSGLTRLSTLHTSNIKHQPVDLGNDSVFCIDESGKAMIIDWRLGSAVMQQQLNTPELSEEVTKSGPSWVYGAHLGTNRIAYGYGNIFSVGDLRNFTPQNGVVFEEMHSESLRQLQFEDNGATLCSTGVDGLIQFWDMRNFSKDVDPDELLLDVINVEESAVDRFVKVDQLVYSIADDQNLRVHSLVDNLMVTQPLNISAFSASFYLDLLPTRHVFVGNAYGGMFLASLTDVQPDKGVVFEGICVMEGHKEVVRCVSWTGNENDFILSGDDNGVLCQWHLKHTQQNGSQEGEGQSGNRRQRSMQHQREDRHHRPY